MYGSSFHLEQSINSKVVSTMDFHKSISTPTSQKKKTFMFAGLIMLLLSLSVASYAGPSQPRLPGGNGNVRGR